MKKPTITTVFLNLTMCVFFFFFSCETNNPENKRQGEKQTASDKESTGSIRRSLSQESTLEKILQSGKLRVGFEAGYMPFVMTNKEGSFIGFDVDFAKEMCKALGVTFTPVPTAWDGIVRSLLSDKFDIIIGGMTITQERNLMVNFSDPYLVTGQTLIVNNKHKKTVNSYKDLNKKTYVVTTRMGTTGEQAIKTYIPHCTYKAFESESEAVREVILGKADAFVYDLPYCEVVNATQGKGAIYFLSEPFTFEPLAWAINKGDPDFLNWLNNFLQQFHNDGRYNRLYNTWIRSLDWKKEVE